MAAVSTGVNADGRPESCVDGTVGAGAGPWLRSPTFDLALIAGVASLALLLGSVALARPSLFMLVVYADFWLLAYPHAAATFTRIALDRASVRRYWFLLFALPFIVLAATAGVTFVGGVAALSTLYFYWQSWHYTRQSYGIARAYSRVGGRSLGVDRLSDCVVYAFPVWGLLHRVHQRPAEFFGAAFWSPAGVLGATSTRWLELAAGSFALGSLAVWTWRRVRSADVPRTGHTLFVLSHVVITVVSYVVVEDVTRGWLFVNIWHNAQYLLFVWAINARQHQSPGSRSLVSRLSRRENAVWYAAFCLGTSALFFFALRRLTANATWQLLPLVLVAHQAVNFHHYIVDAVIWRSPRARP
jgi:hypothetical protein